jgi:hypothetical protein
MPPVGFEPKISAGERPQARIQTPHLPACILVTIPTELSRLILKEKKILRPFNNRLLRMKFRFVTEGTQKMRGENGE